MTPDNRPTTNEVLSPGRLRPSGALLGAHIALSSAIQNEATAETGHAATTIDLLLRLELSSRGALRAVELSDQLMLSASHISRMIDRAEAAGLVQRAPDPDDRRANQVAITLRGRQAVEAFAPRLGAVLDRVIHDTLTPEEIDTLVHLLGRIESAARTPPESQT